MKCSFVICGTNGEEGISVLSKLSPQVFVKKLVSRRRSLGSFSAAGRLTRDIYIVHFNWSCTTEGAVEFGSYKAGLPDED